MYCSIGDIKECIELKEWWFTANLCPLLGEMETEKGQQRLKGSSWRVWVLRHY